jgi:anti-anti-sigma regulatory factor
MASTMTTGASETVWAEQRLTGAERDALAAFWQVYDERFDGIADDVQRDVQEHPELGSFVGSADAAERSRTQDLIRRAIVQEEWEPYFSSMRATGATYAEAGLSFSAWFEAGRALRMRVIPALLETYADRPERLAASIRGLAIFVDMAMIAVGEGYVRMKERIIREQEEAIRELSTPVLELQPGLLILPVIGLLDSVRARGLTTELLRGIASRRARVAVLDVTGVPAVDSVVANHLMQSVQAARLMGATTLVSGLSAENAQTLVRLGLDLTGLTSVGTLADAVEAASRLLGAHANGRPA